ncbi:MAG: HemK/PrmC family methyltransferase [Bacilli bacterium]
MNNIHNLIRYYQKLLISKNRDENIIFHFLEYQTGLNKFELLTNCDYTIDEKLLGSHIREYINGKSAQYITNFTYFYTRKFYVDERVLIPRFETEEVVTCAINIINKHNLNVGLDVGSGSGNIAITLDLECQIDIDSVDISKDAITVAKKNNYDLNANVKFFVNDLLNNLKDKYDFIISNPPYIALEGFITNETRENEPHLALFGGEDGMDYYREIVNASKKLKKLKFIIFEIGFDQGASIQHLWKNINIIKDINGNDRVAILDMRS